MFWCSTISHLQNKSAIMWIKTGIWNETHLLTTLQNHILLIHGVLQYKKDLIFGLRKHYLVKTCAWLYMPWSKAFIGTWYHDLSFLKMVKDTIVPNKCFDDLIRIRHFNNVMTFMFLENESVFSVVHLSIPKILCLL